VRTADAGQAGADDRDACARGGGAGVSRSQAGDERSGRCRLDKQAATAQAAFLVLLALELAAGVQRGRALLTLAGDLVDRQLAALGLGVGCEQLSEAARDGRVGDGARTSMVGQLASPRVGSRSRRP
jgi:hypothetical protein